MSTAPVKPIIIGAGPAGMACAYTLGQAGRPVQIIERDDAPGGLCRTLDFNGYLFDIGGHRFLSKSEEVNALWHRVMASDMLRVRRLSRIYFHKRFFNYPLSFFNTCWNLGGWESLRCLASYVYAMMVRPGDDRTFEGWIINHFGRRLYEVFFKTYTEKVWAVVCKDISADWATQRIRGLSLRVALAAIFLGKKSTPKTLAEEFLYPKTGPGEFYNRLERILCDFGAEFKYQTAVINVLHEQGRRVHGLVLEDRPHGRRREIPASFVFSTMPLPLLVRALIPAAPREVLEAAAQLKFRSFLVVNVILNREHVFPDQWLYIQDPDVRMGRIQNYKNWSPAMTVDSKKTSLGLEYFCSQDDDLWRMNDVDLIDFSVSELEKIKLAHRRDLINGFVVRRVNVYPVYSLDYEKNVAVVRRYLEKFENLYTLGREGLFRYDNSDHALLTGMYAARNFMGMGEYDVWNVNTEKVYLEN